MDIQEQDPIEFDTEEYQKILMESMETYNSFIEEDNKEKFKDDEEKIANNFSENNILELLEKADSIYNEITDAITNNIGEISKKQLQIYQEELESINEQLRNITKDNQLFEITSDYLIKGTELYEYLKEFKSANLCNLEDNSNKNDRNILKEQQKIEFEEALTLDKKKQEEIQEIEEKELIEKIIEISKNETDEKNQKIYNEKFNNIEQTNDMINLRIINFSGTTKIKLPNNYTISDILLYLKNKFLKDYEENYDINISSDIGNKQEKIENIDQNIILKDYSKKTIIIQII
jgi:hypothetical protein